ncbi:hypothetical protein [Mycobacterium parascrofulaceum]|nr:MULTISPECIES: hypothetical protein [Mycobacterium]
MSSDNAAYAIENGSHASGVFGSLKFSASVVAPALNENNIFA